MPRTLLQVLLLTWSIGAMSGQKLPDKPLDLQFPDAVTGVDLHLSALPPQVTLLAFWQPGCEPCLKDFPVLSDFASAQKHVRVLGVSLSDRHASRRDWENLRMPFPTLVSTEFPEDLLVRFGNPVGAVPYSVMLDAQRHACWSAVGQIHAVQLQQALQDCGFTLDQT